MTCDEVFINLYNLTTFTRWNWLISVRFRELCYQYLLDRRLRGPQRRFGHSGEEKNFSAASYRFPTVQRLAYRFSNWDVVHRCSMTRSWKENRVAGNFITETALRPLSFYLDFTPDWKPFGYQLPWPGIFEVFLTTSRHLPLLLFQLCDDCQLVVTVITHRRSGVRCFRTYFMPSSRYLHYLHWDCEENGGVLLVGQWENVDTQNGQSSH